VNVRPASDEAYRHIEMLAREIGLVVACVDLHIDPGMRAVEPRQPGREPHRRKRAGGRDRDRFPGSGETIGNPIEQRERIVRGTVQLLTGTRELQRAVHAMEERLSDLLFQRLDLAADRRLGDKEFLRRAGKAQVARRDTKAAKQVERQPRGANLIHYHSACQQ